MNDLGTKPAERLPGDLTLPWIGQTLDFYLNRDYFLWQQYQRHGEKFKISFMGRQVAIFVGARGE